MGPPVIGVVRGAAALAALTFEAGAPDADEPWRRMACCMLRPLSARARPALQVAWRELAAVVRWDATTLAHVHVLLRETVPALDVPGALPALAPALEAPPRPKPTAAHPRAYRGTKYRPPRPAQPTTVDVRPYLLTRRHTDEVLALLGDQPGRDPYLAYHHGVDAGGLDPWFVTYVLPLLRGCAWPEVGAFAALARGCELRTDPALYAALVGVYRAAAVPARALAWWGYVLAHDADLRVEIAQQVSASGVAAIDPPDPAAAAEIASVDAHVRWSIFQAIAAGAAPRYVVSGIALDVLAAARELPTGRADVTALVRATLARLARALDDAGGVDAWRARLWTLCGELPELVDVLAARDFAALSPAAAVALLRIAATWQENHWERPRARAGWCALAPKLPLLLEFARGVPEAHQAKLLACVGEVHAWAVGAGHDVVDMLAKSIDPLLRLARPPFARDASIGPVLAILHALDGSALRAVSDAPDASWLALERVCLRRNQRSLLVRGLNVLAHVAPALLTSTFATAPGALAQTADALASLSYEDATRLLRAYAASPLADPALADAPLERLCELVAPIARAGGPNPVRRALRDHLAGAAELTACQVRGHRARIVAALGIVRLAAIRQAVERALAARLGLDTITSPAVLHGLQLLDHADVDRRQLRRALAAALAGDRDWVVRHPRSRAWFAGHPRVDATSWLGGLDVREVVTGLGEVRLAIERDPLEALQLGTYVGSCLGRGGGLEYAAIAVMLDVNKQVVYARDARGVVLGRQLVALSEGEHLVCFAVHGAADPALLEPVFRRFDHALAAALGVPVYQPAERRDDDTYFIASILSQAWWADGVWMDLA